MGNVQKGKGPADNGNGKKAGAAQDGAVRGNLNAGKRKPVSGNNTGGLREEPMRDKEEAAENKFYASMAGMLAKSMMALSEAFGKAGDGQLCARARTLAEELGRGEKAEDDSGTRVVRNLVFGSDLYDFLTHAIAGNNQDALDLAVRAALEASISAGKTDATLLLAGSPSKEMVAALSKALEHEDELVSEGASHVLSHFIYIGMKEGGVSDEVMGLAHEALRKPMATYQD